MALFLALEVRAAERVGVGMGIAGEVTKVELIEAMPAVVDKTEADKEEEEVWLARSGVKDLV